MDAKTPAADAALIATVYDNFISEKGIIGQNRPHTVGIRAIVVRSQQCSHAVRRGRKNGGQNSWWPEDWRPEQLVGGEGFEPPTLSV